MSILERLQRLAQANLNWLLDRADPPGHELDQRAGELSAAIDECKAEMGTHGAALRRLEIEFEQALARHGSLQEQAESAVAAGDDDLARRLLAERIPLTERLYELQPQVEGERRTADELRASLAALEDQLRGVRRKKEELARRAAGDVEVPAGDGGSSDPARRDRMVEEALELIKKRRKKDAPSR